MMLAPLLPPSRNLVSVWPPLEMRLISTRYFAVRAAEADPVKRRRGKQRFEPFGLRGLEVPPQDLAGLPLTVRIRQRANKIAHQRHILFADPDLDPRNALLLEAAPVRSECFVFSGGHDQNSGGCPE